ncbi:unnamed protein product, partial [Effrenium voratum]
EAPQNLLWEAREALLIMLQGLKQRNVEPKPSALCSLLDSAALLSVRDTQWFYLCQKLLAHQPILAKRSLGSPESLGESFDEADLAKATLALARLSFPQLIDAGSMFSRAAAVRSPQAASAVLEAAAIFALTERKPQDLSAAKLSPLVLAVDGGLRTQDEKEAETLPRLFPFSGILAAQAADPEVLARWRSAVSTATAMAAASRGASPHFQDLVLQELSTWEVGLETDVVVGPMTVPFALSLVELASFVRRQRTADSDSDMEDGSAPEAEAKSTLQAKRLARRKRQAAAPRKQDTFIAEDEISLASLSSEARPETHILIDLLTDVDFYHASPSQGERRTGRQLSSERRAELQLLRRLGWHVVCVPEHSWQLHGDSEAAEANREMIFKLAGAIPELGALLPLGPSPRAEEVDEAISPFFGRWRLRPRFSTHLLDLLGKRHLPDVAKQVLECMWKWRLEISFFDCSAVVAAYDKAGRWEMALVTLHRVQQFGQKNVACFNAAISACDKGKQWRHAVCLLTDLQEAPNAISVGSAISACGKAVRWETSVLLLSTPATSLLLDGVCWNGAISACEKASLAQAAARLLRGMGHAGIRPDTISYNAVCTSFANRGLWRHSLHCLQRVLTLLKPSIVSFNSCIAACSTAWRVAAGLFGSIRAAQLSPTLVSRSSLAAAVGSRWRRSLAVAAEDAAGQEPATRSAAISACTGRWRAAVALLAGFRAVALRLDLLAFGALMAATMAWERHVTLLRLGRSQARGSDSSQAGSALSASPSPSKPARARARARVRARAACARHVRHRSSRLTARAGGA